MYLAGKESRCVCKIYEFFRRFSRGGIEDGRESDVYHRLVSRIRAGGPLTLADYMNEVLTHPVQGYYTTKNMIGKSGDFVTSPEVSQLFGEALSRFLRPEEDVQLRLVEIGPRLSAVQEETLCSNRTEAILDRLEYKRNVTRGGVPVTWYRSLFDVPQAFSFYVANEFFDALPVHQLRKTEKGWREVLVDEDPEARECRLRYVLSREETPVCKLFRPEAGDERETVEVCPRGLALTELLARRIKEDGGFALIIDYGHDGDGSDTFRAFRNHRPHHPLLDPGTADLTADVDFSSLRRAAGDAVCIFGPVTQRTFLYRMGIRLRLNRLLESAPPDMREELRSGYETLTCPDRMGERFKFLALFPSVLREMLRRSPPAAFFPF
ncbi:protein arginine methyltransferase NDUFAF7, mitochondrial-like isoform X3 [Centruroides sculpturatus]|uniref:protein arginine methyltransferase NDUFAF7, mitochondrial-like isoform X3 n=1 Tax=Centruroides sculpturatus TaxID=218467 RepID=UPI000C6EBAB4|nr:protein arginine methyltransferase NDUFAF7, mitochondrial-like isoform X3 [Centruroides sculpturatus]